MEISHATDSSKRPAQHRRSTGVFASGKRLTRIHSTIASLMPVSVRALLNEIKSYSIAHKTSQHGVCPEQAGRIANIVVVCLKERTVALSQLVTYVSTALTDAFNNDGETVREYDCPDHYIPNKSSLQIMKSLIHAVFGLVKAGQQASAFVLLSSLFLVYADLFTNIAISVVYMKSGHMTAGVATVCVVVGELLMQAMFSVALGLPWRTAATGLVALRPLVSTYRVCNYQRVTSNRYISSSVSMMNVRVVFAMCHSMPMVVIQLAVVIQQQPGDVSVFQMVSLCCSMLAMSVGLCVCDYVLDTSEYRLHEPTLYGMYPKNPAATFVGVAAFTTGCSAAKLIVTSYIAAHRPYILPVVLSVKFLLFHMLKLMRDALL